MMTEQTNSEQPATLPEGGSASGRTSDRRRVLKLGAIAVPAVATLSPSMALAQGGRGTVAGAAASIVSCTAPIDMPVDAEGNVVSPSTGNPITTHRGRNYVKVDGKKVEVFMPPPNYGYSGEALMEYHRNGTMPHSDPTTFNAHLEYLKKVQNQPGVAGYTCLTSMTSALV